RGGGGEVMQTGAHQGADEVSSLILRDALLNTHAPVGSSSVARPSRHSQPQEGKAMSTSTQTRTPSALQAGRSSRTGGPTDAKAWVAKAPKQPLVLEAIDLGPLGPEDVEVAVEHCGLCHSDLSVLNNDCVISQYPAILGHEVTGRVTTLGPNAKGLQVGQRVGLG